MLTSQLKDAYRALNLSYDAEWEKIMDRARSLKHRYKAAGDKRSLARVYKAFSILEADRKKRLYGGDEQLIGRSRRDRELDGMYNHMTKEIAKRRREETAVGGSASAERVDLMHTVVADDTVHTGDVKEKEETSLSSSSKEMGPPMKKAKDGEEGSAKSEGSSETKSASHQTKMSDVDWPAQFARMRDAMTKHEQ
ncbi:hypothetical protein Pmar_PMAR026116 [Perkinsus marinus ATCC 50983]|uniref:J domain-containing protein n=1 Tax=Perkinsus marinus (strain ATCC 50983 / TXsc) TaxID=423536 RepID=C5L1Q2_PERM5|nr:hypothetical protein Pmar_PMAR026116 [Perkinsus marinus ATCC 50983]EER09341.1 hypothetical protein Pmar_PMAR026116 [Perkinsus marinus ATCC 50983]|eukprot:XP_002777525.1 hypothetical protein Pmar_PMAR026116 [Perkinsus marinus ATCC 50983]